MKSSFVSIIVPVYKVDNYLDNCINSVIHQTLENFEIILVDDGSPDKCPQICDEWAARDSRIRVIHKENGGLSSARNAGIKLSTGKYLFFLDSDDRFSDMYSLEKLWSLVQSHEKVDMVQGNFYIEEISRTTFNSGSFPVFTNEKNWIQSKLSTLTIPESACNRLIKRSIIIDNGLYFKEGWIQEDTLWTYQISRYINSIAFCYEPTYFYAYNSNSIMHSSGNEREAKAFVKILNEVYTDLRNKKIYSHDIKFLEIVAARAEKAVGTGVYDMIIPDNNLLFRYLFRLNSVANNTNNSFLKYNCKLVVLFIRILLCNKILFTKCN